MNCWCCVVFVRRNENLHWRSGFGPAGAVCRAHTIIISVAYLNMRIHKRRMRDSSEMCIWKCASRPPVEDKRPGPFKSAVLRRPKGRSRHDEIAVRVLASEDLITHRVWDLVPTNVH